MFIAMNRFKVVAGQEEAFEQVWQLAHERKVSLRTAAFMLAVGRVGRATVLGGIS